MANQQDLQWFKGEDVTLTVTMIPLTDITGWTLQFTLRKQYGDVAVLITKTIANSGIQITSPTTGVFKVFILSADTASLDLRAYVYDIQRIDSGNRAVLCVGSLTLLPEVAL